MEFKLRKLHTMVVTIVVFGELRRCELIHSVRDLNAAQVNKQLKLVREIILYEFSLSSNDEEATESIFPKSDGIVDHSVITRQLKKFHRIPGNLTIRLV